MRALIEKEKLILKKEKKMVKEIKKGQSSRVKLNIGGHKVSLSTVQFIAARCRLVLLNVDSIATPFQFETSLATLTKHGGSMFAAMFSGRHHVEPDEVHQPL